MGDKVSSSASQGDLKCYSVIHTKGKTGGLPSLLQVKKRLFSKMVCSAK